MTIELEEWMWRVECGPQLGTKPRWHYRPTWNNGLPVKVAFLGQRGKADWWWRGMRTWERAGFIARLVVKMNGYGNQYDFPIPTPIEEAIRQAGLPPAGALVTRHELRKLTAAGKLQYAGWWGREEVRR